ncbi:hypothetical protein NM680_14925 [Paracoccus sp. PS-1]|uniref:hypothetical protein n=1 Tax=Paracoccus sp. PS1 TaxID=2963938 RepID=UPI0027E5BC49|nr:hypothetical protein [Paracoccus sp. PS1]MDQ7263086.1 hypothetical protein [Paracoccus sp. PS1]
MDYARFLQEFQLGSCGLRSDRRRLSQNPIAESFYFQSNGFNSFLRKIRFRQEKPRRASWKAGAWAATRMGSAVRRAGKGGAFIRDGRPMPGFGTNIADCPKRLTKFQVGSTITQ